MEEKKAEVVARWREVKNTMRVFTVNDLKPTNRKACYPAVSQKIETLLVNLLDSYDELFDMMADKDGDEMKAEQQKCIQQESEIKNFLSSFEDCYYELEAEEASIGEASVPAVDKNVAGLEQVMKEQPENSRRREEEEKWASQEKERITKEIIEAKFHAESKELKREAELISSLASKIPLGTWKNAEDKVKRLKQRKADLIAQMAEAGFIPDDIPGWPNTWLAVNQAANSVQEVSVELKSEDAKHFNVTSVTEKVQYPLFEGSDEECFADFKVKLEKAFKHNQTVKSAKATKIKELLRGNTKNHIPDSMENIDDIYKALDRAFGNLMRLLN